MGTKTQAPSPLEEVTFESGSMLLVMQGEGFYLGLLPCNHVPQEWDSLTLQKGVMSGFLPMEEAWSSWPWLAPGEPEGREQLNSNRYVGPCGQPHPKGLPAWEDTWGSRGPSYHKTLTDPLPTNGSSDPCSLSRTQQNLGSQVLSPSAMNKSIGAGDGVGLGSLASGLFLSEVLLSHRLNQWTFSIPAITCVFLPWSHS